MNRPLVLVLILAMVFRLFVLSLQWQDPGFHIQQDNYLEYAAAFSAGNLNSAEFPRTETRLFPGYALAISTVDQVIGWPLGTALLINLTATVVAIWLFYSLTKNLWATTLFAFFPPVWVELATKVATEPLAICLLLLAAFQYQRKWYWSAGLILGLTLGVRLVAVAILVAMVMGGFSLNKTKHLLLGFITTAGLWLVYNQLIFGDLLRQIVLQNNLYPEWSPPAPFGPFQLADDIPRSWRWGQYEIFLSGSLYLLLTMVTTYILWRRRKQNRYRFWFWWQILVLMFVMAKVPIPFLEELGRYLVPLYPSAVVALTTGYD